MTRLTEETVRRIGEGRGEVREGEGGRGEGRGGGGGGGEGRGGEVREGGEHVIRIIVLVCCIYM